MPANNGIPELKVTGPVRGLVPAAFALAALCFFLSFGELRYYGLRVAGMTGMDLVLGHPPRPDPEGSRRCINWDRSKTWRWPYWTIGAAMKRCNRLRKS
ncbi:MAG: hypothetical protein IPF78_13715 [Flavobacteriales bacterium]|nr:hypothetical protein [Flavobacteriales bacterium]